MKASSKFYRRASDFTQVDTVRLEYNSTNIGNGGVSVQFEAYGDKLSMFMTVEEARKLATYLLVAIQNDGDVTILELRNGSTATLKPWDKS